MSWKHSLLILSRFGLVVLISHVANVFLLLTCVSVCICIK